MRVGLQDAVRYRIPFRSGRLIGTAPVALAPLLAATPDELWWIPGGTDSLYAMGPSSSRLVGRLGVPFAKLTPREKTRIKDAHLSQLSSAPEAAAAVASVISIPDSISSLGSFWAGEDRSLWFRITSVGIRDVGSVWIQAQPDASIVRCFSIPPEKRILAFGRKVAIVATRDTTDDTYGVGVARLSVGCPTGALRLWR